MNRAADMPALGSVIDGRFKLMERLGEGNFGAVYSARQLVFDIDLRTVAIKWFKGGVVNARNARVKLNDAIQLIRLADEDPDPDVAEHLVHILDVYLCREPLDQPLLVMELVPDSRTLHDAIRDFAPMPVELSLLYLQQILVPLRWMHTLPTPRIHNDIKPENLLLTARGQLKLGDFGLASMLPGVTLGGTIPYQSPETLLHQPAGTWSDVYAVGVLWYEMLTGVHPFAEVGLEFHGANDQAAYAQAHAEARKAPFTPATALNPDLSRHLALADILERALAYSPADRYRSANHLWNDIQSYLKEGRVSVPTAPSRAQQIPIVEPIDPETPERQREQATRLLERGCVEDARRLVEQLVKRLPHDFESLLLQTRIAIRTGRLDDAWRSLDQVEKRRQKEPEWFEVLAEVYEADAQPDLAKQAREDVLKARQRRCR